MSLWERRGPFFYILINELVSLEHISHRSDLIDVKEKYFDVNYFERFQRIALLGISWNLDFLKGRNLDTVFVVVVVVFDIVGSLDVRLFSNVFQQVVFSLYYYSMYRRDIT